MEEMSSPSPSSEVDMKQVEAINIESDKENVTDQEIVDMKQVEASTMESDKENVDMKQVEASTMESDKENGTVAIQGLNESRNELLTRVNNLKQDLQEWRGRLDLQVKNYRQELGDVRTTLNTEVEQLRTEFQDLRNTLKQQLEATSRFTPEKPSAEKSTSMQPEFEGPNHSQESQLALA